MPFLMHIFYWLQAIKTTLPGGDFLTSAALLRHCILTSSITLGEAPVVPPMALCYTMACTGKNRQPALLKALTNRSSGMKQGSGVSWPKFKFIFEDIPRDDNRVLLSEDALKPKLEFKGHHEFVDKAMSKLNSDIEKFFSFYPLRRSKWIIIFKKQNIIFVQQPVWEKLRATA